MSISQRPSVLVVDGEVTFVRTMAAVLEDEGFAVRTVPDVPTALAELTRQRPDLVLSDIWMPGASRWDLAERLITRGDRIPLVLMSAMSIQARAQGVRFVRKGDGVGSILAAVHEALAPPVA